MEWEELHFHVQSDSLLLLLSNTKEEYLLVFGCTVSNRYAVPV